MRDIQERSDVEFWMSVTEQSLDAIWNNSDDDVYADLFAEELISRKDVDLFAKN